MIIIYTFCYWLQLNFFFFFHFQPLFVKRELLTLLEEEQKREQERENMLQEVKDPVERERLDKIFGIERAKAADSIKAIEA